MNIYQDSGYVDMRKILNIGMPFTFLIGARGTGKTYTSLKTSIEDGIDFLYTRRLATQFDKICKPQYSPFESINDDMGWDIYPIKEESGIGGFYHGEIDSKGKVIPHERVGTFAALSTFSNLRGFDSHRTSLWIHDEFIPEAHERPIKEEGTVLFNAYETINRNRELKGKKPLQLLCMANSNQLDNDIFITMNLVMVVDNMKKQGKHCYINNERGVAVFDLSDSPISEQKKDTALYRLVGRDSDMFRMAINNEYYRTDYDGVKTQNIKEYKPFISVGELCIYRHKSKGILYVSPHMAGSPKSYRTTEVQLQSFRNNHRYLALAFIEGDMLFENIQAKVLLKRYLDL